MSCADRVGEAAAIAGVLLRRPVDGVEAVDAAGRNSRVERVRCGVDSFALKRYPPRDSDRRDRLGTELRALAFLHRHGIVGVPRVVASDPARGVALFEWIDGEAVASPDAADIDAAVAFLSAIHALRTADGAREQPFAAEACLSGAEVMAQIERRIARLGSLASGELELAAFLSRDVRPLVDEIAGRAERIYARHGLAFPAEIPDSARSLCPSDFGFHNALRTPVGRLAFVDFDYFGWDDPAKLVSDFLLHPGMALSEELRRRFAAGAVALYGADPLFIVRLRALYPLFALRWCLILLNEFLPERWALRLHAGALPSEWQAAKRRQLDRAREWVQSLAANFRCFPYA